MILADDIIEYVKKSLSEDGYLDKEIEESILTAKISIHVEYDNGKIDKHLIEKKNVLNLQEQS